MNEFLRNRNDQLLDFVNRGIGGEEEMWQDGTLISTATARLTPEQSKELALKIMALIDEAVEQQPQPNRRERASRDHTGRPLPAAHTRRLK